MTKTKLQRIREALLWQAYGEYLATTQPWRFVKVLIKGLKNSPDEMIEFKAWKAKFLKEGK